MQEGTSLTAVTGTEQRPNSGRGRPFQKGQSGNPGGRPKIPADVREALDAALPEAVAVLEKNLKHEDPRVAHLAAVAILDRALGKPAQALTLDGKVSMDPIATLFEAIDGRTRGLPNAS